MKPYEKLAKLYDRDRGKFSLKHIKILNRVKKDFKFKPESILDLSCGTGVLVNALSKKSFNVIGTDISSYMIRVARKNYPKTRFFIHDMSELNLNQKFDLILCAYDSMNYLLSKKELLKTFLGVKKHLNRGGLFIFDFNTPYLYKTCSKRSFEREINKIKFKQVLDYNACNKTARIIFDFGDGQEIHNQKAYNKTEIKALVKKAGFKILEIFQDFDFNKPINLKDCFL